MPAIRNTNITATALLAALALLAASCARDAAVRIYPAPDGAALSDAFMVAVEGRTVPVYAAKVPPAEPIPRLNGSSDVHGLASFASFDMDEPVRVTVTSPDAVTSVKVLPTSYGIVPEVDGNTVAFTLDRPRLLTIEVNGDWHASLHLFANPFEMDVPAPGDPGVIYFGPGIHEVTSLAVGDGATVYIAGGAVVRCVMAPEDTARVDANGRRRGSPPSFVLTGTDITFRGRGIIDAGAIPVRGRNMLFVGDATDVTVEGVTLLDSSPWTMPIRRSTDVHVDNVKIIGWRGNSDGIDICNCTDVLVENCFLRTLDDLVVIKSDRGQGAVSDIRVRGCVLWNELAHALSLGAELREPVSDVVFEDCDIIHDVGREWALRVYHCDSALLSGITFQNIRVEEARRLISVWIGKTRWTLEEERGHIRGVTFRDITAVSAPIDTTLTGFQDGPDWKPYIIRDHAAIELEGWDDTHLVEDVTFAGVVLDGRPVTEDDVTANEFVRDVHYLP